MMVMLSVEVEVSKDEVGWWLCVVLLCEVIKTRL